MRGDLGTWACHHGPMDPAPPPDPPTVEVVDVPDLRRFEARLEGGRVAAWAHYVRRRDRLIITHTEVSPELEGRGIGSALARGALDAVRAAGERVELVCPFFTSWVRRHKEYADLVTTDPLLTRPRSTREPPATGDG